MTETYAFLPCNGLDKAVGQMAREVAQTLQATSGGELICPVLLHRSPDRYAKILAERPLFVIDGCGTRCASNLASDQGLRVARKVKINGMLKDSGVEIEESLSLGSVAQAFCHTIVADLLEEKAAPASTAVLTGDFFTAVEYDSFTHDKYLFRVPKEGFYVNENDCWARVSGNRVRVGVTDYMQQYLSDIMFCSPPDLGAEIEQFGEVGSVESVKAVFEIVSPVTGKVVAVNDEAVERPELINQDPYEKGWIAELELRDFLADQELLLDCAQYLALVKKKVMESSS